MNRKTSSGLEEVPGGFEVGHFLIPRNMLFNLGLLGLLDKRIECGCGIVGDQEQGTAVCMEAVTKGPALEEIFRRFLASIKIIGGGPTYGFPRISLLPSEISRNDLIRGILENHGESSLLESDPEIALRKAAQLVTNVDVASVLNQTNFQEPLCRMILEREAALLAYRLAVLQRGLDNLGPVTFALIGGVGRSNIGHALVNMMTEYTANLRKLGQVPVWGQDSKFAVGEFPSDETNLWGNVFWMLNSEKQHPVPVQDETLISTGV
ncbi:MAG: hypothetical protein WC527_07010 [Candidatus Margulisiibacteriota bacterium]